MVITEVEKKASQRIKDTLEGVEGLRLTKIERNRVKIVREWMTLHSVPSSTYDEWVDAYVSYVFILFDACFRGCLDSYDLPRVLRTYLGIRLDPTHLSILIESMDEDQSGQIDLTELQSYILDHYPHGTPYMFLQYSIRRWMPFFSMLHMDVLTVVKTRIYQEERDRVVSAIKYEKQQELLSMLTDEKDAHRRSGTV